MAREIERGEVWLYRFAPPDKRRPVLVLSRSQLLRSLHTATVAAITSSLRGSPTEVEIGPDEGLRVMSCVNLTNLFTVRQSDLRRYVGSVGPEKMRRICEAMSLSLGCE